jgi:hypothetical protein
MIDAAVENANTAPALQVAGPATGVHSAAGVTRERLHEAMDSMADVDGERGRAPAGSRM